MKASFTASPITLLALAAVLAASTSLNAQVKTIDKRTQSEANQYYLCFVAMPAGFRGPGHAFVVFGMEDSVRRVSSQQGWGQYPVNAKTAAIGVVPGGLVNEALRGNFANGQSRLIVRIDSRTFARAQGVRQKWMTNRNYQLVERDCVTFTAEVARSVGLNTPNRQFGTYLPISFIQTLIQSNR